MDTSNFKSIDELIHSYSRFVPSQIFNLIGKNNISEVKLGDQVEKEMTVLFTDIRNFTSISESLSPQENFNFINSYLRQMEPVIAGNNGLIDKYIGDAIMALFPNSADDALCSAVSMLDQLVAYNLGRKRAGYEPINIGFGLNSGFLILGTVGSKNRMESTVIGDAVNLASRLESITKTYGIRIAISEHTYHNLQDRRNFFIRFIDRIKVKGKNQPISIYEVFDNDDDMLRKKKLENNLLFDEALSYYHYKEIDKAESLLTKYLEIVPEDYPAKLYLHRCNRFKKTGIHECASELTKKINWSSSFELNHNEIDSQHKNLVTTAYSLIDAMQKEEGSSKISEIINFLDNYVTNHFQTEEKIMEFHNYPFLDIQKRQHNKFVNEFARLKKKIREHNSDNKIYIMFRIQILVIDWILNHTLKEDKHFGKYLKQLKS